MIMRPETLVRWYRAGFRRDWRWKSRRRGGRPPIEAWRWLAAAGMTKEAALLQFNSVHFTVSTICRISFVCAQARIEAE